MYDVIGKTVLQLQRAMEAGETTSCELVLSYMERMKEINLSGPALNAILELNVEAVTIAMAMDRERKVKGKRSELHGIPVLIKGCINTADSMHTSGGTRAFANSYAVKDAFLVKKLREAGAVILGKANLTELARYYSSTIVNGYSAVGGQVRNAYCATMDAGGSSTGSAVAVAASLCAVSVGAEACGSILYPASCNGVVGLKPTVGTISRSGIMPVAYSQDTAGPIGRCVEDVAVLMNCLVGEDEEDPATWCRPDVESTDYTGYLDADGLKGKRIGVNNASLNDLTDDQKALYSGALKVMEEQGAILVPDVNIPNLACDKRLRVYEFKHGFNAYVARNCKDPQIRTLEELIEYNQKNREVCLRYGQDRLMTSEFETSGRLIEEEYLRDKINCHGKRYEIAEIFDRNRLDAVVFPGPDYTDIPAITNFPGISVPAGYCPGGEPFSVTFMGKDGEDGAMLSLAYGFEQTAKLRKEPVY